MMRLSWSILQLWNRIVLFVFAFSIVVFVVFESNDNNNNHQKILNRFIVLAFSNRIGFSIVKSHSCVCFQSHSIECIRRSTSAIRENDWFVFLKHKNDNNKRLATSATTKSTSTTSLSLFLLDTVDMVSLMDTATTFLSSSSAVVATTTTTIATTSPQYPISPEPIHTAFTIATFVPQPFWLLLILLPNNTITKRIMGGLEIPLVCCLIHLFIVVCSIGIGDVSETTTAPLSEFNNVFDPTGDPQYAFMGMTTKYPNFVAEEWSHVLTWDLLVGRYIWMDGIKRKIFTSHSVLLSNLIGPPGLLLHWFTCTILYKKPIVESNEKDEIMNYE